MEVDVRVFATLRRYMPEQGIGEALRLDVQDGATLGRICDQLGIPRQEIKIVMQNGLQVDFDTPAEPDARIAYIPAVGGG